MALSKEDNDLLTLVQAGSPMGDLFRCFWFPVLLSDELPVPDSPPIRVRALGEYLVAFRDSDGRLGLLDAGCPHRGADLAFGVVEEGGIRCARCYWKFDVEGNILDLPLEPDDSPIWNEVKASAHKLVEYGGLLWAYIGSAKNTPELPEFEWTRVPQENRFLSRFLVECNYMQAMEGGLDAARVQALKESGAIGPEDPMGEEVAHDVKIQSTEYGLLVGTGLESEKSNAALHITQWMMPFYTTSVVDRTGVYEGVAWVPVDNENTMAFPVTYSPRKPLSKKLLTEIRQGKRIHPKLMKNSYKRELNRSNGFLAPNQQRTNEFASRFSTSFEMAIACQESMGSIVDRTHEMLSSNDAAVENARKKLMQAAVDLMEGTIPVIINRGDKYRVRSFRAKASSTLQHEEITRGIIPEI